MIQAEKTLVFLAKINQVNQGHGFQGSPESVLNFSGSLGNAFNFTLVLGHESD
jgi:hypothetical protein